MANQEFLILDIDNMRCAGCSGRVQSLLTSTDGVSDGFVNLVTGQASVEFDPDVVASEAIIKAVSKAGYPARIVNTPRQWTESLDRRELSAAAAWRSRLLFSLMLLTPLLWLTHFDNLTGGARVWWQFLLATPLQIYVGWPYAIGAWRQLRHGSANMDTLVALGTGVAYAAGIFQFAQHLTGITTAVPDHGAMYFTDAAMILTFITFGKFLESKSKRSASLAIRRLLDLSPPEATVLRDEKPAQVPVEAVLVGETILVRPGEQVPLDAEILSGNSALDQSWLTGESIPVERSPGEEMLAGTINGEGSLTGKVLRGVGSTAIDQVIELVRHAQETKSQVGRMADRVVAWFVPVLLCIAALTALVWGLGVGDWSLALSSTVAVLVVACPCALGLATPTAVLVGSGRGAEQGILIKDAISLETAGQLTTVLLDKTGTVTEGRPQVVSMHPIGGASETELLTRAATAEQLSAHPLSHAIVKEAADREIDAPLADRVEVLPGQGIVASFDTSVDQTIRVGNEHLMAASGIDTTPISDTLDQLRGEGNTALLVALDDRLLGCIAVADPISPNSREGVEKLYRMGLKIQLLSGDNRETVQAVARQVGIGRTRAELLPGEKQEVVRKLQKAGQVVAMVGDGINDAPALAAADLGIAIGTGSDVAIESADVVLVSGDLRAVGQAIRLSRATLRTIRQNLAWALVYNLLLIPLAAGVLIPTLGIRLPPAAAAAAMAASSVSVVSNSLLLRRKKL